LIKSKQSWQNNTNNKSDQSETLPQLYEVLLYKKKDIIAIQEKLGIIDNDVSLWN
jgi:hypothetical protein